MTITEQPVDCVTPIEAARILNVSRQRVYTLVNKGQLPVVRPWPRKLLIPRGAVEERLAMNPPAHRQASTESIASTALRAYIRRRIEDDPVEASPATVYDLALEFIAERRPEWNSEERRQYADIMSTRWTN
jgi:excisionase family DNA binding protein